MTPNLAVIQVQNPYWRGIRLWIPLFLLWIPFLVLAPLLFLVLLAACFLGRVNVWRAIAVFWGIVCALPGTNVHVRAHSNQVVVRIL